MERFDLRPVIWPNKIQSLHNLDHSKSLKVKDELVSLDLYNMGVAHGLWPGLSIVTALHQNTFLQSGIRHGLPIQKADL
jgi:hypothetical protein